MTEKVKKGREMKPVIRTPYFEIGTKNYIYGDTVLEYAKAADAAAEKYDIDVLSDCTGSLYGYAAAGPRDGRYSAGGS